MTGARTFADYDVGEARRLVASKPRVVLREDPFFGREGFAREVLADAEHGYLVLVVVYAIAKNARLAPNELPNPRYWVPGRVELAR